MPHYYSAKTSLFYDSDIVGEVNIPTDAVVVSDADYAALFLAQRKGAKIRSSASGALEAVSEFGAGAVIDLTTVSENSSYVPKQTLAEQASDALSVARTTVMNDYYLVNETIPQAWVDYQVALRGIANGTDTTSTTLPTAPTS